MRIQDGWTTAGRGPGWLRLVVALVLAARRPWQGRVRNVPDGDSLTVERGGRTVKVRLYGIDSPGTANPAGARRGVHPAAGQRPGGDRTHGPGQLRPGGGPGGARWRTRQPRTGAGPRLAVPALLPRPRRLARRWPRSRTRPGRRGWGCGRVARHCRLEVEALEAIAADPAQAVVSCGRARSTMARMSSRFRVSARAGPR